MPNTSYNCGSFGNYLKRISKYKVLSDNEVLELAEKIRAYLDIKEELEKLPELTKEEKYTILNIS